MTPAEIALRDAFLSECWAPCPEVPRFERATVQAASSEQLAKWSAMASSSGFASCSICGVVFRQPSGERAWKWCPKCVAEVA